MLVDELPCYAKALLYIGLTDASRAVISVPGGVRLTGTADIVHNAEARIAREGRHGVDVMGDGGTRIAVRDLAILQLKKRTACKCVWAGREGEVSKSITTVMGSV